MTGTSVGAYYSSGDLELFIWLPLPAESGYDASALSPYAFRMDAFFALQFVLQHFQALSSPQDLEMRFLARILQWSLLLRSAAVPAAGP